MRPEQTEISKLVSHMQDILGGENWKIRPLSNGARASWRWLSVTVKYKPNNNPDHPWRARLRDGFPRSTVTEVWVDDPIDGFDRIAEEARNVRRFVEGEFLRNPSKSWLAHRLWEAVRPVLKSG